MVSHKAIITLRAVFAIAEYGACRPVRTEKISEVTGVPGKYLQIVLTELSHSGLLQSVRGRLGGYRLARPAREITYLDIIKATDDSLALAPCIGDTQPHRCAGCYEEKHCIIRKTLILAGNAVEATLAHYNVEMGLESSQRKAGKTHLTASIGPKSHQKKR